jgi:integrase
MNDFIIKKRQTYYARLTIPKHLHNKLGKTTFVQSLKTRDIREANIRKHSLLAQWRNVLEVADGRPSSELEKALSGVRSDPHDRSTKEDIILGFEADEAETYFQALEIAYGDDLLLAEHVEAHLKSLSVAPKTLDERKRALSLLLQKYTKTSEVSRQSLKQWANTLLRTKAKATVTKQMSTYRIFWEYLEQITGVELGDPFISIIPKSGRKTKAAVAAERKAFTSSDIHKLISEAPDDDLKQLITMAAYSGCRIEELCSLKIAKVTDDKFIIEDAKSAAGNREIPIHKDITQLVARLVDTSTDEYLISDLTFNMYGDRSNAISKRFGRLKRKLGYDERYVFHSIRKTFASRLEVAEVPELLAARLLGHEVKTISYGLYSSGSTFQQLRQAINQVRY